MLKERVQVTEVRQVPGQPDHVTITARALTQCHAEVRGPSGNKNHLINIGDEVTITVPKNAFRNAQRYAILDGAMFAYYKMNELTTAKAA